MTNSVGGGEVTVLDLTIAEDGSERSNCTEKSLGGCISSFRSCIDWNVLRLFSFLAG
jgi:hypothetical protein